MFQQRAPRDRAGFAPLPGLWQPPIDAKIRPQPGDAYVAVDDLLDDRATLVIDPWPRVDHQGRLVFDEDATRVITVVAGALHAALRRHRRRHRQAASRRELRIGDAFLVRDLRAVADAIARRNPIDISGVTDIVDVTPAAREAAKKALHGAVAPVLHHQADGAAAED